MHDDSKFLYSPADSSIISLFDFSQSSGCISAIAFFKKKIIETLFIYHKLTQSNIFLA